MSSDESSQDSCKYLQMNQLNVKKKNQIQRELEDYIVKYLPDYDGRMVLACKRQKIKRDKCWRGDGRKGILGYCWWKCKLVQ